LNAETASSAPAPGSQRRQHHAVRAGNDGPARRLAWSEMDAGERHQRDAGLHVVWAERLVHLLDLVGAAGDHAGNALTKDAVDDVVRRRDEGSTVHIPGDADIVAA
jgi:hypothetical protein